jgi:hypothetical protein
MTTKSDYYVDKVKDWYYGMQRIEGVPAAKLLTGTERRA